MGKVFFGFAISDSMFPAHEQTLDEGWHLYRRSRPLVDVIKWFEVAKKEGRFACCCNSSHTATIKAMTDRFGLDVDIPATPPKVELDIGDTLIVMSVRGLPRLTDRHEYTFDEINKASFTFAQWSVFGPH
jgi:hypothetical protein